MAQDKGPEFIPQYRKKQNEKNSTAKKEKESNLLVLDILDSVWRKNTS
jgi:hypothetical protein